MIKVDIVNEVSRLAEITKVKAEVAVDAVFDAMRASMMRGERIELRGFGVFQVKPRKRGIGRNPRTGKEVKIPPAAPFGSSPARNSRTSAVNRVSDPRYPPPGFDLVPPADIDAQDRVQWSYTPVRERPRFQHRYRRHVLWLLATILTTTWAGSNQWASFVGSSGGSPPTSLVAYYAMGLWYSIPVLLILGAHEFGHYIACRIHRVDATLPYFLPAPIPLSGTLGAVIRIHEAFPSRKALFDIGVAGPIAGFVVLVPFAFLGLAASQLVRFQPGGDYIFFGEPLLMKALSWLYFGPLPTGIDITPHPMWFAAWWGMLATALNLMPFGQLDGGHIAYAVLGNRAKYISIATLGLVLALTVVSRSWAVTAILLVLMSAFFGFRHPQTLDDDTPVGPGRVAVAILAAVILIVSFMPVPVWF